MDRQEAGRFLTELFSDLSAEDEYELRYDYVMEMPQSNESGGFVMDLTEDGRRLKMMPAVDEYTRECLSIDVERSITAEDVVETLASLFRSRGEPAFIRSDNGPEFIANAVKRWLDLSGVRTLYIEPGSPWENAYSETLISRFSDELLKREVFAPIFWKRRCWWRITVATTTTGVRTARWAT